VIVVSFQQLNIQGFGAAGAKSVHAMGCMFSREAVDQGDIRDTIQAREIDKRIAQQSTAEKKVQKLLLLGTETQKFPLWLSLPYEIPLKTLCSLLVFPYLSGSLGISEFHQHQ
jgi:hypothetical protein